MIEAGWVAGAGWGAVAAAGFAELAVDVVCGAHGTQFEAAERCGDPRVGVRDLADDPGEGVDDVIGLAGPAGESEESMEHGRTDEYASRLILASETGQPHVTYGNVPNHGLIDICRTAAW